MERQPVAPARERGLKYNVCQAFPAYPWVAPARERGLKYRQKYDRDSKRHVAPARERGLKCTVPLDPILYRKKVAPTRERGLKCGKYSKELGEALSLP